MTNNGALVLPNNAVCLHDDEMRYVEGGARKEVAFKKSQQAKFKKEWNALSSKTQKALAKKALDVEMGIISLTLSGLGKWFSGTLYYLAGLGTSYYSFRRTLQ